MAACLQNTVSGCLVDGRLREERVRVQLAWTRREYEMPRLAWNDAGDIGLIFIGEDFDLDSKLPTLRSAGGKPHTEAECLVRIYEQMGPKFVSHINGRFTGVILDRRKNEVILFNDRYAANRTYFHASSTGFFFSSKATSLLAVLPHLRQIDPRGLAEFYSVGCVLQNRSLFSGVSLLPPASLWTFTLGAKVKRERYFDPCRWEALPSLSAADYGARLAEVFGRVAPKYLRGPASVAMSLTGGLDSRMILAWARAAPGALPCYTFGGPYRECADVRIARDLAKVGGQPHTTLRIEPDFFSNFSALAEETVRVTDGTMDVSGAIELYVNRRAREIGLVRLTGNYGSEILRSNVAFRPARLDRTLFTPEFGLLLDQAADTYRTEAAGHRLSFIAFKQVPWHHHARFAAEQSQLAPRSPFLDNELVALAFQAPPALAESATPLLELIAKGTPAFDSIRTDRSLRARVTPTSAIIHRWQEFTAKAEYAYDYGMPRWLARTDRWLKPLHLEKLFLGRHKFYHFRVWYRDRLRSTLEAGLAEKAPCPPCYRDGAAKRLLRDHLSGAMNRTSELHQLLTAQSVERQFLGSCPN
jgi:asparagine synthase (glutamine-hydrolysing)